MKLIIDIPDFTYEEIKKTELTEDTEGHIFHALSCIKDGTHIPENATNGDVLKCLLYGKAIITEFIHDVNISVNNKVIGQFDREWWNSPYKRGETE